MQLESDKPKRKGRQIGLLLFIIIGSLYLCNGQYAIEGSLPLAQQGIFDSEEILSIKLSYSNREIRRYTNDSTYINTSMSFSANDSIWKTLDVAIRARGNFRREHCYFTPLKLKITSSAATGTLFSGHKKLKLVLPCFNCKDMNDKVIKEYMAYKLYETVSPYHFKTRLAQIEFSESRGAKIKKHHLIGILIEDIKSVARRHEGRVLERHMRALAQEATTSVRNNIFHFMIGNTDYSTTYQHNQKLLFIDKKMIPVPYDFDMSGLVNAHYSVVSKVQNQQLPIDHVTERIYKGYKRESRVFEAVRQQFIQLEGQMLAQVERNRPLFRSKAEFTTAKKFLLAFFDILEQDNRFETEIIAMARD